MPTYIYNLPSWPRLHWQHPVIAPKLADVSRRQGRLVGRMEALGFEQRSEAVLATLTEDVVKSSEIEGESLDREQVRSSIARRLGMETAALAQADRNVEGIVEVMLDATQNHAAPLTAERLFGWQAALFPAGRSGMKKIAVGRWRDSAGDPMQVVSGAIGHERIHFEAPEAGRVAAEMASFLGWFGAGDPADLVLKAAVAHLRFVTIHPFEDGNGRIARAIADMALARSEASAQRFYSMSSQIRVERAAYYDILESTQRGGLDITGWLVWFLDCMGRALDGTEETLAAVIRRARFWKDPSLRSLNERQRKVLDRLLAGFEGKLTSSKWARITGTSPDTALRDITDLLDRGILRRDPAGGRSTSYSLVEDEG